jgi:hypothetical protein
MPKKIITYIVFISFLHLIGCYSTNYLSYSEFEGMILKNGQPKEFYIITKNAQRYHLADWGLTLDEDSVNIKGAIDFGDHEEPFIGKISIEDIESIEVESINGVTTTVLVVSIVGISALAIALGSKSGKKQNYSGCSGSNIKLPTQGYGL